MTQTECKPQKGDQIFIYGTLRPGCRAYYMLEGRTELIGRTTVGNAALYSLGAFPGLKLDENSTVTGALLKVTDERVFDILDRYEGHPHFYTRQLLDTPEGHAWGYVFQGEVEPEQKIMSGDWMNQEKKHG